MHDKYKTIVISEIHHDVTMEKTMTTPEKSAEGNSGRVHMGRWAQSTAAEAAERAVLSSSLPGALVLVVVVLDAASTPSFFAAAGGT